jgi:hypothetical protein
MTTMSRRSRALATAATLTTAVTTFALAAPASAADGAPVAPTLLPVAQAVTRAADVSPAGVVVGTGVVNDTGGTLAHRWQPRGPVYLRQRLAAPAELPYASATGVTDRGEPGGNAFDAVSRAGAYRWSTNGRGPSALIAEPSSVAAVGPGEWLVNQGDFIGSTSTIVARDGTLTPITGLAAGTGMSGMSLGGPQTALVAVRNGIGQGSTSTPYVWEAGASQALPVNSSFFFGPACVSDVLPDGSVAYSGLWLQSGGSPPPRQLAVLRGGVDGTTVPLQLPPGATHAQLSQCGGSGDTLSTDGYAVGHAYGTATEAVVWNPDGSAALPGLREGESSSSAVAVASGGRAVLLVTTTAGSVPYLWRDGIRTPLRVPAGWKVDAIVELTDGGLVVGNISSADGQRVRPVVWRTGAA